MDDDHDLRDFSGTTRLFPLPGVVLFPHAVLPLHIFEPRYRQMTEDALAGDRFVTIVALRPTSAGQGATVGPPAVEEVGCLGRIIRHERLPDARFNFLLLGRKRVRLQRELAGDTLYRTAAVEILEDLYDSEPEEPRRSELIGLFRRAFERHQKLDPDLSAMLENALPLGVLADIVAHALGLPDGLKQRLLAEPRVNARVRSLLSVLRQIPAKDFEAVGDDRPFPPPFSCN